jgi:hypothetical protein
MSQTANDHASAPVLRQIPRRYLALGLIIVAICLLGALVIVRDNAGPSSSSSTVETFNAAPSSLISSLAAVPTSVYEQIGVSSPAVPVAPPQATGSSQPWLARLNNGPAEPVLFFYGAEFAPYAAVQRWPVILALSRFGTFNLLGLMQSSSTTAFSGLSTFTFWKVNYTSKYVILESVERYSSLNPTGARYLSLETADGRETAAVNQYGGGADDFPLVDVSNRWVISGASFMPSVIGGLSQSQIAGDLTSPTSPLTQAMVAAANEITATICAVDGQAPAAVCGSRGVQGADALLKITPGTQS